MCELTIEIKAPYSITLLIDGKCYSAQEDGLYKITLEPETQHELEIRVEELACKKKKTFNKIISLFKFKGRHTDNFHNVFYKANFIIFKKYNSAKITFEYKKFTTINFEKKETPVAFVRILRKSKIDILNEEKTVFKNKKYFLMHFVKHRWFEIVIATAIISLHIQDILITFFQNQRNLYESYEIYMPYSFASNPLEKIIESSIFLLFWVIYWTVGNILFVKRSLKISKWSKDEDDKSSVFYKSKFFF